MSMQQNEDFASNGNGVSMKQAKQAKRVRFYRNGDAFFDGLHFAVGDRFRTFESLLAELTSSTLCDNRVLPKGVRFVFTTDGRKVTTLDDLQDGESYVVSSLETFKKLDYGKVSTPNWNLSGRSSKGSKRADEFDFTRKRETTDQNTEMAMRPAVDISSQKGRVLVVLRNGIKPRKFARILLNTRTAHSFNQVLDMIGTAFQMPPVKKLFTFDRRQITTLAELLQVDGTLLAYGAELKTDADFILSDLEMQALSSLGSVSILPPSFDGSRKNSIGSDSKRLNSAANVRCSSAPGTPRMSRRADRNGNDLKNIQSSSNSIGGSSQQFSLFGTVNANFEDQSNGTVASTNLVVKTAPSTGGDEHF